jgi:hypothetical protein
VSRQSVEASKSSSSHGKDDSRLVTVGRGTWGAYHAHEKRFSKAIGHRNTVITERHYLKWVPKLREQLAENIARTW